ncbi:MAG TPA: diguanylate cyclase [Thermoleophilaceae bacterium]|nr:diguanylate cyclase [Thermoleophilaceae bacterium]
MTAGVAGMNRVRGFTVIMGLGLAAYAGHVVLGLGGEGAASFFQDWLYNGLLLAAAASCLLRAFAVAAERARWLSLGGAILCLFSGELYYTLHLSNLDEPPYPSVSDALYLAFYPAGYAGLVLFAPRASRRLRANLWLDGLVSALAVAALAAALLLQPITASTGGDRLEVATTLAYPLADVTLLVFVVGLLALNGWKPSRSWALIAAGLATMAVADGVFLWQSAHGAYVEGQALDAMWPAAAVLLGLAAWQTAQQQSARLEGWRMLAMPALFALVPVGLLVYGNLEPMNRLALALAAAALVVAIVRMALTFAGTLRMTAEATRAALTDALTDLGNRRALLADLEAELAVARPDDPSVLVLFDLDGFKDYNDAFGHPAGDALLVRLGHRLREAMAGRGCAYRLGGDEFCALLRHRGDGHAEDVERALAALSDHGEGFHVASSHGTVVLPAEARDTERALQLADGRLYTQKGVRRRHATTAQLRDVLLQMVSERTPDLRHHIDDVAALAHGVGQRLRLRPHELHELVRAAELHDIGKMAIPDAILDKEGSLEVSEWEFMRRHTVIGERMLHVAPALSGVARLVRSSHERMDGSGYPDGLRGGEIPLGARIVAVCDAYHAMTSERPYQRALKPHEALAELTRCAGRQFDPEVVAAIRAELAGPALRPLPGGRMATAPGRPLRGLIAS